MKELNRKGYWEALLPVQLLLLRDSLRVLQHIRALICFKCQVMGILLLGSCQIIIGDYVAISKIQHLVWHGKDSVECASILGRHGACS